MRNLRLLSRFLGVLVSLSVAGDASYGSVTLEGDTNWTASMNPIRLESLVTVPQGVALTVSEGAEIVFEGTARLHVEGALFIRGASDQPARIRVSEKGTSNAKVVGQGSSAIIFASHGHFAGVSVEARENTRCELSNCRFDATDRPVVAVRSRIDVQDCDFRGIPGEGIVFDSRLAPSSLRVTLPPRMVAGKTITFRVDVLDEQGDLYWWMWEGTGTVAAFRHGTNDPATLSKSEFRLINGIGSLTTILDEPGAVDLRFTVGAISATRTIEVLNPDTQTLRLTGMLPSHRLDWGPDDGVIRLSGQTIVPATGNLVIRAGALVMLDLDAELEVIGTLRIEGTFQSPVYFFATHPLQSWAQIRNRNSTHEAFYDYAIFTGGGVGPKETGEEHTFDGPVLRFRPFTIGGGKGARISHCVFADNEGKGIFTHSGARYVISDCLFTRCEFGAELHGDTIWIEDTHFLDLNTGANDQDALYLWRSKGEHRVRRCIFAYNGDDGIDTWESDLEVSDCLIYGAFDKNISLFLNDADIRNCLFFGAQYGVQPRECPNGLARIAQSTFADHTAAGVRVINAPTEIDRSVLWGNTLSLASFPDPQTIGVSHSILSAPDLPISGEGNRFVDPRFRNAAKKDYRLAPDSPGIGSGPNGENLGWLGFPRTGSALPEAPSIIRGCRFEGGGDFGVLLRPGTDCQIEDSHFVGFSKAGVKGEGRNWLEVRSSLFLDCDVGVSLEDQGIGILDHLTVVKCPTAGARFDASDARIENCILWNCGSGVASFGASGVTVSFSNIVPGLGAVFPGLRNLNTDPLFLDPESGDYRLRPESPCIRAGSGRTDMGAFQTSSQEPRSVWFLK